MFGETKLRTRTFCALAFILMFAVLVVPVSAKSSVEYRANGKLEEYIDGVGTPSAEVVNGHWSVKVKEGKVDFKAFYRERNLGPPEQSPVGTIDEFWIYLTELYSVDIDQSTGECTITGEFYVKKKWWILPENPDYPPPIKWQDPQWTGDGTVTINPSECIILLIGHAHIHGPTLSIKY